MRDYKKHLSLLPHRWQVVGAVALAVAAVYFGVMLCLRDRFNGQNWFTMCIMSARFLLELSLLLICFSKEKVEDEYIVSARYRALIISVFIFIIGWMIVRMIEQGPSLARNVIHVSGMKVTEVELFKSIFETQLRGIFRAIAIITEVNSMELIYIVLLKILVRTGRAGGYDSLLLPYRYKKTGWWIFIASLIMIPVVLLIMEQTDVDVLGPDRYSYIRTYVSVCRIMAVFPYIGLMIICFSKEKQEDEFIRHIRTRVLAYFVIVYVIADFFMKQSFIVDIWYVTSHNHSAGPLYHIIQILEKLFNLLSFVPLLSLAYALVLKKVLSNNLKESNDEK